MEMRSIRGARLGILLLFAGLYADLQGVWRTILFGDALGRTDRVLSEGNRGLRRQRYNGVQGGLHTPTTLSVHIATTRVRVSSIQVAC